MVNVPVFALRFDVMVIFEFPVPPKIDEGLKLMLVLLAVPDADRAIDVTYPELTAVVMVTLPVDPLDTVSAGELEETLKTVGIEVMVMLTVAVAIVAPSVLVPVTVMPKVPVAAVGKAVKVSVDVPEAPIWVGLKLA